MEEYKDRFEGIGTVKEIKVDLKVDPDFKPVTQPPRRQPFNIREKMKKEIQYFLDQDTVEKVNEPTGWVSPPVVYPKKDQRQIRLNADMRVANQAIPRRHTQHPTIDDVIVDRVLAFGYVHGTPPTRAQGELEKCNDLLYAHWSIPIQEAELWYEVCR